MGERKSMTAFPSMFAKLSTFILKKCLLSDFILFGSLPYLTAFEAFTALLPVEISPSLFISLPSINHTRRLLRRSRLFSGEDGTHFSPLCSATCERCILLFVIWVNFSWGNRTYHLHHDICAYWGLLHKIVRFEFWGLVRLYNHILLYKTYLPTETYLPVVRF